MKIPQVYWRSKGVCMLYKIQVTDFFFLKEEIDGNRKYHPQQGKADPNGHAWNVLMNKWILAKSEIIQLSDHMKLN